MKRTIEFKTRSFMLQCRRTEDDKKVTLEKVAESEYVVRLYEVVSSDLTKNAVDYETALELLNKYTDQ